MRHKCEAPAWKAGATRELLGGGTRSPNTSPAFAAQFPIIVQHLGASFAAGGAA